jgi:hypothetical protein
MPTHQVMDGIGARFFSLGAKGKASRTPDLKARAALACAAFVNALTMSD